MFILTRLNELDHTSAAEGCTPSYFTRALENDQRLLVHIASGVPNNFQQRTFKNWLKFSVLTVITLGPVGVTSRNVKRDLQ